MSVISLTTDFGVQDWFVGSMKGVIARIAPKTRVIDLTHGVPPGDIGAAAFTLNAGYRFFPRKTIHVIVVDPGVGSAREALAIETADFTFVGPDNGVLSLALKRERIIAIRRLKESKYFLPPVSQTFHGRDIFAPVAAHLSLGVPSRRLGPAVNDFVRLAWPEPRRRSGQVTGAVVYVDRFGNGITNLPAELLADLKVVKCAVYGARRWVCPVKAFYQEVAGQKAVAVLGSSGYLEVAVNGGSAKDKLGVRVGTKVLLQTA